MQPTDVRDLRSTIIPRSDQLNSEQLLGGPMIITVSDVRAGSGADQPVSVYYELDPARPFKPCKTMRKLLIFAWGQDGTQWIGKSMELFNEPSVKFGGEEVGGIRISRMSDINPRGIDISLTATKGRKEKHRVELLKASAELTAALAAIEAATNKAGLEKAKALAKALAPADAESALAAYKRKVESLKAAAAPKSDTASTGFDLAAFTARAAECPDEDALMTLTEEVAAMPEGADKTAADGVLKARFTELSGDA
jgi:hypothetical protein